MPILARIRHRLHGCGLARIRHRLHGGWLAIVPAAALPGRAAAHASDAAPDLASAWTYDPGLLLPLAAGVLMYATGLVRYWRRAGPGHGIRVAEAAAFFAGTLALSAALVWPLDVLGEWSLAMHMAQHMLLIAVAAPLILLGRPGVVWLKALPAVWARRVTRPARVLRKRKTLAAFAGITAATLLQTGVMWGWHAPKAMQFALTNDLAHYAMHGTFLAAGLFFWWTLFGSLRGSAAGFGSGAIALVGTMVQMGLLSALLTFSQLPRYPWYFERSPALGLTPLEDQQLAGLVMWIPGAVPYLVGALWLMAAWLRRSERGDARRRRAARQPPAANRAGDDGEPAGLAHGAPMSESETQRRIYEAALSNTPDLVYVFDLDHRFIYANEALLAMWGKSREEALGRNCLELGYEPWHAAMHDREIDQVIATRRPVRGEVPFTGTAGRRIYDYIFVPVTGPDGEVVAVAGTTRDITDRQRAEQAIREQAARLSAADRAKDEFLAVLAHELRNPLAPLKNSLSLLGMTHTGDVAAEKIHETMERQVNHLVRLVDDLLEMSRITHGALTLQKKRVDVAQIVRNAVETSAAVIDAAGHELSVSLPERPLWLHGDPVRLSQILGNLVNNAAKYTAANGKIEITAREEGDTATISVRDNGAGIAPDLKEVMFEMFSRGGRADAGDEGGLGIGLALARRLAEMHGGTLTARSDGIGHGSEFVIRLPLAGTGAAVSAAEQDARVPLSRRRVLVVDDNRDAADSLGMILEYLGADVRIAYDGEEALAAFREYDPSVVLLDIGMPGLDGYEVARAIRAGHPQSGATLIALTGWGQEDDRRRAREAGFDHHLIKPAETAALQALLSPAPGP